MRGSHVILKRSLHLLDASSELLVIAELSESARWKRNGGSDFVFLDPHPGIAQGPAGGAYLKLVCEVR